MNNDYDSWLDRNAVDASGTKIGKIGNLYLDDSTNEPEWVAVNTGLFGTHQSFAPTHGARLQGDDVMLGYSKEMVEGAPRVDPDDDHLSAEDERELYGYYGRADAFTTQAVDTSTDRAVPSRNDDDSMVRSEEELEVGTRTRDAGRARLRKYVVTENVSMVVPVRREEVRVVREDISSDPTAVPSSDFGSDDSAEVVLHEEEVLVEKHVVPRERVRLEVDQVVEEQDVSDTVRKERIEFDEDVTSSERAADR